MKFILACEIEGADNGGELPTSRSANLALQVVSRLAVVESCGVMPMQLSEAAKERVWQRIRRRLCQ